MLGEDGGTSMIKYLEETEPDKCRDHPDAPNIKDCQLVRFLSLLIFEYILSNSRDDIRKPLMMRMGK